jgi:hypothetical protein
VIGVLAVQPSKFNVMSRNAKEIARFDVLTAVI